MPPVRPFALLAALVAGSCSGGCAEPEDDEGAQAAAVSAYTVDRGDRFVVSATPHRIVLARKVDGVAFPFDERSLLGKAVLIHPVNGRAAGGVYARALSVTPEGDRYVVDSAPLTLAEMESIAETDIVRIFIDSRRPGIRPASQLRPLDKPTPTTAANIGFDGLNFTTYAGLSRPALLSPGVTFAHAVEKSSLDPEVLVDWSADNGLELGMRASLGWKSKVTISGRGGGELFRSSPVETPPLVVMVPIGPVPVPVTLSASAVVTCAATVTGPLGASITIEVDATVGGSFYVHPSATTAPSSWVREGRWQPVATGTASLTPGIEKNLGGSVDCAVPRIELNALVAGTAGPYLAVTPAVSITSSSPSFAATLSAGVKGTLLGASGGGEITLLTWKP